eukprot:749733-Hanusia_phi.AAC.1
MRVSCITCGRAAIDKAADTSARASGCCWADADRRVLRRQGSDPPDEGAPVITGHIKARSSVTVKQEASFGKAGEKERLLKGYMVSSVNEWGADQTRILLVLSVLVLASVTGVLS